MRYYNDMHRGVSAYGNLLKSDERAVYSLRALYSESGYSRFRSGKFEEYELYGKYKDFLGSDGILTFTDSNGKLMALKPDVTLSIAKNAAASRSTAEKFYYNDEVYRLDKSLGTFREISQTGIECIGNVSDKEVCEVISLAVRSLETIGDDYVLDISHMGIIKGLAAELNLPGDAESEVLFCMGNKNLQEVGNICAANGVPAELAEKVEALISTYGSMDDVLGRLADIAVGDVMKAAADELRTLRDGLRDLGLGDNVRFDFSVVNDMSYYNGVIFKGFVKGLSESVLSGGRYDNLMEKMGKKCGAIGFSVSLDLLAGFEDESRLLLGGGIKDVINIALPKGRLGNSVYEMFAEAGYDCPDIMEKSRKLVFENADRGVRFFWVKPSDVAIYVERGAADIGVVGKDVILEENPDVYELLDLKCGACRMMVAGKKEWTDDMEARLKVATKFPRTARRYYGGLSRDIDIIKLNGSIELAPILNLSDVIVDLVETGKTLKANGLEPKEEIVSVSARLISNKAGFKFKQKGIESIRDALSDVIGE